VYAEVLLSSLLVCFDAGALPPSSGAYVALRSVLLAPFGSAALKAVFKNKKR